MSKSNPFQIHAQASDNYQFDANHIVEDAQHLAGQVWNDLRTHGPVLVKEASKNPLAVVEAGAAVGLAAVAVTAESPFIIGLAGAAAVGLGCAAAGQAAKPYIQEAGKKYLEFTNLHF